MVDTGSELIQVKMVWLDEKQKIASFHPIDGCACSAFVNHAEFIDYLVSLQKIGYRFQ